MIKRFFSGTLNRTELLYRLAFINLWFSLFIIVMNQFSTIMKYHNLTRMELIVTTVGIFIALISLLALFVLIIGCGFKRARDCGWSQWWGILMVIPLVGLVLMLRKGHSPNLFKHKKMMAVLGIILFAASSLIVQFI